MSQRVIEGLFTKLSGTAFATALSNRVYMHEAPLNADLPLARVALINSLVGQDYGPSHRRDVVVQIDLYGKREDGSEALGDINTLLYTLLQGANFAVTDHAPAKVRCLEEGIWTTEQNALRIVTEWQMEVSEMV